MGTIKTFLLMAGLMLLFMYAGELFGGQEGMKTAFWMAGGINIFAYFFSDKLVLSHYKAIEIDQNDHSIVYPIVRKLADEAGLPMPKVYIIPDKTPNAFATGRNPSHAAVAVNQGLLDLLNEDEIEAVLAHEMSHVKHRDILICSVAAVFVSAITYLGRSVQYQSSGRQNTQGVRLLNLIGFFLIPVAATLVQMTISRTREYAADRGSALLTKHPEWLISALDKLDKFSHQMPMTNATQGTAHLFIINPLNGVKNNFSSLFSTHPSTVDRIERLIKIKNEL